MGSDRSGVGADPNVVSVRWARGFLARKRHWSNPLIHVDFDEIEAFYDLFANQRDEVPEIVTSMEAAGWMTSLIP